MFLFRKLNNDSNSNARTGLLTTPHGIIQTPAFIFCATKGSIKSLDINQVKNCDTQIILSNTYHLMLQPGADLLHDMGGLHKFIGWDGPLLTDSGGFQIFSLGHGSVSSEIKGKRDLATKKSLLKITEEGAMFKSYINGDIYNLTPELSTQIQYKIGADIVLVLDECTPYQISREYTEKSMEMSHRWALRSLSEFNKINNKKQALYGIVQGGIYDDLRNISCNFVNDNDFFGCAIGGTLGGTKQEMQNIVQKSMLTLRKDRPIHLLGIGGFSDILHGVACGIDTFDCVHPTRLARHGGAFSLLEGGKKEYINLSNSRFARDEKPIDPECKCITCATYSRAYIHHLIKAKEISVHNLLTQHNMCYMNNFMSKIRDAINQNTLKDFAEKMMLYK